MFIYLAPIPHTSGRPLRSLLLIWTQLYRCDSHVDFSYSHGTLCFLALVNIDLKVIHLKCRYRCLLQSILVIE